MTMTIMQRSYLKHGQVSYNQDEWQVTMPANIALIKYMGKACHENNRPLHGSLSYTLNDYYSQVKVSVINDKSHRWESLPSPWPIVLSAQQQQRLFNHVDRIGDFFGVKASLLIQSGNAFPSDCGLASSASCFAALTCVVSAAYKQIANRSPMSIEQMAMLSAQGSGSSCRSFFTPWSYWDMQGAKSLTLPYQDLKHMVVIIDTKKKMVSSSKAHRLVDSSLLMQGRAQRATQRLEALVEAIRHDDWTKGFALVWQEFWDMHALFATSNSPFMYIKPDSMAVLSMLISYWDQYGDGPWVTMDAGANVHLLFRSDQQAMMKWFCEYWQDQYQLMVPHEN